MVDLTQWTTEAMLNRLPPLIRRGYQLISFIVTIIFIVAVILYAIVRAAQAPRTNQAVTTGTMTLKPPMSGGLPFPAVTVCPDYVSGNSYPIITAISCTFWQNKSILSNCPLPTSTVAVMIEGNLVSTCISFNNAYSSGSSVVAAQNPGTLLSISVSIDQTNIPPGDSAAVIAIFSPQGPPPSAIGFSNSIVADIGKETLVMARYIQNSQNQYTGTTGAITYSYQVSAFGGSVKSSIASNSISTMDIVFPDFLMYSQSTTDITIQLDWIAQVGGLAALLYFFHIGIFWVVLFIFSCLCGQRIGVNEPKQERLFDQ